MPLRKLANELDSEIVSMGNSIDTLVDVEFLLGQLVCNMSIAVYRGEEKLYYHEHFRKLKLLAELIRYTMNDLSGDYQKSFKVKEELVKMVLTPFPENKESQPTANELTLG